MSVKIWRSPRVQSEPVGLRSFVRRRSEGRCRRPLRLQQLVHPSVQVFGGLPSSSIEARARSNRPSVDLRLSVATAWYAAFSSRSAQLVSASSSRKRPASSRRREGARPTIARAHFAVSSGPVCSMYLCTSFANRLCLRRIASWVAMSEYHAFAGESQPRQFLSRC